MQWPDPPFPPGYQPLGIGFFAAALVAILLIIVVVLIMAGASGRLRKKSEEGSDMLRSEKAGRGQGI
jgi:hypothetical protein